MISIETEEYLNMTEILNTLRFAGPGAHAPALKYYLCSVNMKCYVKFSVCGVSSWKDKCSLPEATANETNWHCQLRRNSQATRCWLGVSWQEHASQRTFFSLLFGWISKTWDLSKYLRGIQGSREWCNCSKPLWSNKLRITTFLLLALSPTWRLHFENRSTNRSDDNERSKLHTGMIVFKQSWWMKRMWWEHVLAKAVAVFIF
jgi:hypothetical protein